MTDSVGLPRFRTGVHTGIDHLDQLPRARVTVIRQESRLGETVSSAASVCGAYIYSLGHGLNSDD